MELTDRKSDVPKPKAKYVTPKLVEFGAIEKLTQGSGTQPNEGAGMHVCL
jgi:hypothetical protein